MESHGHEVPFNDDRGSTVASGQSLHLRPSIRANAEVDLLELDLVLNQLVPGSRRVAAVGMSVDYKLYRSREKTS